MIQVMLLKGCNPDALGMLPYFLDDQDPRPAAEQFDANYAHGGGWRPIKGFTLLSGGKIKYPGDPAHKPFAQTQLRDEVILFYDYGLVAVLSPGGKLEVARMD